MPVPIPLQPFDKDAGVIVGKASPVFSFAKKIYSRVEVNPYFILQAIAGIYMLQTSSDNYIEVAADKFYEQLQIGDHFDDLWKLLAIQSVL